MNQQMVPFEITTRVLLVEDEPLIINILMDLLYRLQLGLTVNAAVDGAVAAKKLQIIKFDLVITDLHMPRADGAQLIKQLRGGEISHPSLASDYYQKIPIILKTAMSGDKDIRAVDRFCSKHRLHRMCVPEELEFVKLRSLVVRALSEST